ncbi:peptidoglycan-binding protein [uncultured Microbacterium sp.]|uniref:peptidoglycan-binding domain-containing protein n=1 Tax=uncultured Microbacterium sp. TaxID=191216 RepID=UPI0035CC3475
MARKTKLGLLAVAAAALLTLGVAAPSMADDATQSPAPLQVLATDDSAVPPEVDPAVPDVEFRLAPELQARRLSYCNNYVNITPSGGGWYRIPASGSSIDCVMETGVVSSGVGQLQLTLNICYGAGLTVDNDFGPATYNALLNAQSAEGIAVDGVYGSQSRTYLKWRSSTTGGNCAHGYSFGV